VLIVTVGLPKIDPGEDNRGFLCTIKYKPTLSPHFTPTIQFAPGIISKGGERPGLEVDLSTYRVPRL
jgi:hypothetical protein